MLVVHVKMLVIFVRRDVTYTYQTLKIPLTSASRMIYTPNIYILYNYNLCSMLYIIADIACTLKSLA